MGIFKWLLGLVSKSDITNLIKNFNINAEVTAEIAKLPIDDNSKAILVANVNSLISVIINIIVAKILGTK